MSILLSTGVLLHPHHALRLCLDSVSVRWRKVLGIPTAGLGTAPLASTRKTLCQWRLHLHVSPLISTCGQSCNNVGGDIWRLDVVPVASSNLDKLCTNALTRTWTTDPVPCPDGPITVIMCVPLISFDSSCRTEKTKTCLLKLVFPPPSSVPNRSKTSLPERNMTLVASHGDTLLGSLSNMEKDPTTLTGEWWLMQQLQRSLPGPFFLRWLFVFFIYRVLLLDEQSVSSSGSCSTSWTASSVAPNTSLVKPSSRAHINCDLFSAFYSICSLSSLLCAPHSIFYHVFVLLCFGMFFWCYLRSNFQWWFSTIDSRLLIRYYWSWVIDPLFLIVCYRSSMIDRQIIGPPSLILSSFLDSLWMILYHWSSIIASLSWFLYYWLSIIVSL